MAILEIHHERGLVERVTIAHDQPAMFGSSPKCEIVLTGAGVIPFHGRIRWIPKKKRFKVDASPGAEYVVVNGQKMASSGFRQGDEIQLGGNRLFMINDSGPDDDREPVIEDDRTRVQPAPVFTQHAPGPALKRSAWQDLPEVAAPSAEVAVASPSAKASPDWSAAAAAGVKVKAQKPPERGWARVRYLFSKRANAPGEERVLSSPLVFGLGVTLAVLVLVGFALYGIIERTITNRLYDQSVENLEDGDYRNAIKRFDEFLRANPDDPRVNKARVHRAMANVRQYTSSAGGNSTLALEAEREMLESVGSEEAYRDSSTELAELVIKTGESLADRARAAADPKVLAEAESAVGLHAKIAGGAADALLKRSKLPDKIVAAKAAVRKQRVRREKLAAMDAAITAGSSTGVYAARDALVDQYADQAVDRELLKRMTAANDLIRKAVTVDPSGRPGETEPHPEPAGPPTSLVLRSAESAQSFAAPNAPLIFGLADGLAYAVDGASGTPVWQVPVGLGSPFRPQPVAGVPAVLVVDARHQELVRLELRTGKLVWRQALDGPVVDPPLVLGNQVIQVTPAGKILIIDLASGALRTTVDLKMPLARTPVTDEAGQALYVVAEKDCLFVLTRDPLACVAVEYLGHGPGSVACPPARLGRYLIVTENSEIGDGRWRVFLLDESGTRMSDVQHIPIEGWTWGTPAVVGSVVWATGDRGGVTAYAIGAYGQKEPLRQFARINPDPKPSGPAYALARSEREMLVGSGRSARFELDQQKGKLASVWTLAEAGPALAPPQLAGNRLVLTQQSTEGPGVALWGVDPQTGKVAWRTVLGAPWSSPPEPTASDRDKLTALGTDGRTTTLSRELLTKGGFVELSLPRPGTFRLPTEIDSRVEGDGWTVVVPTRTAEKILIRSGTAEFKEMALPAALGARPIAWGKELLVPADDGRVYLIDPLTGESHAEPFVPPFDRAKPTHWRKPVSLGADAVALVDEGGIVRRVVRVNDPRPRLVVSAETALGTSVADDPASTSGAVVVATIDGKVRALSARDLSPIGAWTLDAPIASAPSAVAGHFYVSDKLGGVLALGEDGQRLWSTRLTEGTASVAVAAAGPPAVNGPAVWFLDRQGTLHARSVADGSPLTSVFLDTLPSGGPISVGDDLALPVGPGTLRLLVTGASAAKPEAK